MSNQSWLFFKIWFKKLKEISIRFIFVKCDWPQAASKLLLLYQLKCIGHNDRMGCLEVLLSHTSRLLSTPLTAMLHDKNHIKAVTECNSAKLIQLVSPMGHIFIWIWNIILRWNPMRVCAEWSLVNQAHSSNLWLWCLIYRWHNSLQRDDA